LPVLPHVGQDEDAAEALPDLPQVGHAAEALPEREALVVFPLYAFDASDAPWEL
jgi:hypothetical protein